ncbi:MAG: hypothetical protein RLZZ203_1799 [Cyanobacteriota bacterium]
MLTEKMLTVSCNKKAGHRCGRYDFDSDKSCSSAGTLITMLNKLHKQRVDYGSIF